MPDLDLFDQYETDAEYRAVLVERVLACVPESLPRRDRGALLGDYAAVRDAALCFDGLDLRKSMAGLGSLWGYFPHFMDVKVGKRSLADKLADPAELRRIAEKTVAFCLKHEGGRIRRNRILQSLKAYNGHHVSNFRPVAARDLYRHLGAKVILDPCAGWGGRLLGALASGCTEYVGIDASRPTVAGFHSLIADLGDRRASVVHGQAEHYAPTPEHFDLAFTSPPYWDAEQYSDDPEQSYAQYPTYDQWRGGFLFPLARMMASAVKVRGYVAINIADVKRKPLVEDTKDALRAAGLDYYATYRYVLSSIAGKGVKHEPVLVFKKRA